MRRKRSALRAACDPLEQRLCLSETVYVPTDGSTATSNTVLTDGVTYQLRASGTFYMGVPTDGMADAEYGDFTDPKDVSTGSGVDYGILVNGVKTHGSKPSLSLQCRATIVPLGMGCPVG